MVAIYVGKDETYFFSLQMREHDIAVTIRHLYF